MVYILFTEQAGASIKKVDKSKDCLKRLEMKREREREIGQQTKASNPGFLFPFFH